MSAYYTVAQAVPTTPLAGLPSPAQTVPETTNSSTGLANPPPLALGTKIMASNGQELVWVQAGAAISTVAGKQPFALAIDNAFQAVKLTKALATAGQLIAVAPPIVISDNDFFWAVLSGAKIPLKVGASCAPLVNLWTTATAGVLDDTSGASHVAVLGIKTLTTASASASAGSTVRECRITNTLVPQLIA